MVNLKRVVLLLLMCVFGFLGLIGILGLILTAGFAFFLAAVGGCVAWASWLRYRQIDRENSAELRGFSVLPLTLERPNSPNARAEDRNTRDDLSQQTREFGSEQL